MILVTGATGLVGAHLLYELCSRGLQVKATRRAKSNTDFVKWVFNLYSDNVEELFELIEWVDAEVLDYQSLLNATRGVSIVFHTAATVSFSPAQEQAILATNVRGTANVVDACIENKVKTLCHVSSIAALGDENDKGVIDENCKWQKRKGQSAYAQSKFFGENEVWRGHEQGLRIVIVNPSVILGPGRWNTGSGQLFSMVLKGMPFYTDGVTGYVDVRDVAKAMVFLTLDTEINGERFILNSGNFSFKELFTSIAKESRKIKPFIRIPEALIHFLYPLIFIVTMGKISKANLKSAFTESYYSSDKIKALGFTFTPIAQTIQLMAKARAQS